MSACVSLGRTCVRLSVPSQPRKVASEGRFPRGRRGYVPPKGPSYWFQTESNPALPGQVRLRSSRPGRTGSDLSSLPSPLRRGPPSLPPFPAGGSAGHQLNLLDHNGRRQGALALTRADPGSPSRGRGGVGPSLPLAPSPFDVTQPRGRCSAPRPGAESVRRPGGLRPNQTAPHPRHYLTGELGGQ